MREGRGRDEERGKSGWLSASERASGLAAPYPRRQYKLLIMRPAFTCLLIGPPRLLGKIGRSHDRPSLTPNALRARQGTYVDGLGSWCARAVPPALSSPARAAKCTPNASPHQHPTPLDRETKEGARAPHLSSRAAKLCSESSSRKIVPGFIGECVLPPIPSAACETRRADVPRARPRKSAPRDLTFLELIERGINPRLLASPSPPPLSLSLSLSLARDARPRQQSPMISAIWPRGADLSGTRVRRRIDSPRVLAKSSREARRHPRARKRMEPLCKLVNGPPGINNYAATRLITHRRRC